MRGPCTAALDVVEREKLGLVCTPKEKDQLTRKGTGGMFGARDSFTNYRKL